MKPETKRFLIRYLVFTAMMTAIALFWMSYDFNNVPEFIYSNF